jgi:formyltetrahydrofolate deformylase
MAKTGILLIDCPDRKGIVAAVGDFLYRHNANIVHADQQQDAERGLFLMRVDLGARSRLLKVLHVTPT